MTKTQRSKLEKLLHEACVLRDGEKCLRCGKRTNLQASHIYPKGTHQRMRFVLDNVKTLCYGCHFHFWHKHPSLLDTDYNKYRLRYLIDQGDSISVLSEKMEFSKDAIKDQIKKLKLRKPLAEDWWALTKIK